MYFVHDYIAVGQTTLHMYILIRARVPRVSNLTNLIQVKEIL